MFSASISNGMRLLARGQAQRSFSSGSSVSILEQLALDAKRMKHPSLEMRMDFGKRVVNAVDDAVSSNEGRVAKQFGMGMSAISRAGDHLSALALLRRMHSLNVKPSVMTYTCAMTACEKSGEYKEAVSLFNAISQQADGACCAVYLRCLGQTEHHSVLIDLIQKSPDHIRTDPFVISAMLQTLLRSGEHQPTLEFLATIPEEKLNSVHYGAAIAAVSKAGRAADALGLLEKAGRS